MLGPISSHTKRLAIFLLLSSVVVNVLLAFLPWTPASGETTGQPGRSPAQRITTLHHSAAATTFWSRRHVEDSWAAMLNTWEYHKAHPTARLYEDLFFGKAGDSPAAGQQAANSPGGQLKFQYPPSSLIVVDPIARLLPRLSGDISVAKADARRYFALNAIGYVLLWTTALLVAMIFHRCCESAGLLASSTLDARARFLLTILATLTFYPIVKAFTLGQIQTWLNAGTALVIWCWISGRVCSAGIITAILCAVKPQYGVLLVWGLLRKRWNFAAAFAATLAVVGVASLAMFGLQNHLDYLKVLSHIAARGEGFFPNQSVNGLLNRFFHNGNNNTWNGSGFPPIHPVVRWATLATSIALLVAAFIPPRPAATPNATATDRRSLLDLLIILLTATMASPVAWEHHYGVLLPIFAALAPAALVRGGRTSITLAALYLVASNFWGLTRNLADGPFNILQSTLFFAALGVLIWLYRARRAATSQLGETGAPFDR